MGNGRISIGKPYIRYDNEFAYLCSDINDNGAIKMVDYKVSIKYKDYLAYERSDAFLLAILYYAMIHCYDIVWETPCSEKLIFNLTNFYIPIVSDAVPFFHKIELSGKLTKEDLPNEGGVAAAISGGVDSTYTIYKYLNTEFDNYRLSHVLFTDCFTTSFSEEYREEFYRDYLNILPKQAEELGVDFIFVQFHIDEMFSIGSFRDKERGNINDLGLYSLKYCSIAYALSKLICKYYFSSGQPALDFSWVSKDTDSYDLFTMAMISNDGMQFYSSGSEVNRSQKVKKIADWKFAQEHLQVCAMNHDNNCGYCNKCIRTMSELYSIHRLELFQKRFPVQNYMENLGKRWGYIRWQAWSGHLDEEQLIKEMKQSNQKIKKSSYVWAIFYLTKDKIRLKLRNNKVARRIYESLGLGKIVHGDMYEYYRKL